MKPWHLASILTAAGPDARPVSFAAILALTLAALAAACVGWLR
jgi:hypothetical protein